jgi:hypothetical protein
MMVIYLVGGLEHGFYFPFHIWDVILPIDFHIFQRGRSTTNQIYTTQETQQTIANTEWYRLAIDTCIWKIATISGSFEEEFQKMENREIIQFLERIAAVTPF